MNTDEVNNYTMKKTHSKKQIIEAINRWQKVLDESENLNEANFLSFSAPTQVFKNEGVKMWLKCLKTANFQDVGNVKVVAKFNGKSYPVEGVHVDTKFRGDIVTFQISVDSKGNPDHGGQYDNCITLSQMSKSLKDQGISKLGSTCKGIGLAPLKAEDLDDEVVSDEVEEKNKENIIFTSKIEDVVPSKNKKYVIWKFVVDGKKAEKKEKEENKEDPIAVLRG